MQTDVDLWLPQTLGPQLCRECPGSRHMTEKFAPLLLAIALLYWRAHRKVYKQLAMPWLWRSHCASVMLKGAWCALQFYETGLVDPKLWPFGDDLRQRFELTRVCMCLNAHASGRAVRKLPYRAYAP